MRFAKSDSHSNQKLYMILLLLDSRQYFTFHAHNNKTSASGGRFLAAQPMLLAIQCSRPIVRETPAYDIMYVVHWSYRAEYPNQLRNACESIAWACFLFFSYRPACSRLLPIYVCMNELVDWAGWAG